MKKYEEIEDTPSMASEPVAVYGIPQESIPLDVAFSRLRKDVIKANTVSVDEYFDELITKVHSDYANL